jgi:hypothetical protein
VDGWPSFASTSCMARCALEVCLDEGCWLERVGLREPIEAVIQQLVDHVTPHIAMCSERSCLHFAHEVVPAASSDPRAA